MAQETTGAGPGYDSGILTLPGALTVLTKTLLNATAILLCNLTADAQSVSLTNRAGSYYLKEYPLQANMTILVPLGGVYMDGVKWQAGAAASVNAQLVGRRA